MPLKVGLTGGVASGKSVVADCFARLGVPIIDSDQIARDLVAPGSGLLQQLIAAAGLEFLTDAGELDRSALRHAAFLNANLRHRIETILHPAIFAELERQSERVDEPYHVLVIPLLAETDFQFTLDRVLVVDCPVELQRKRLQLRDSVSSESAAAMIAVQATREQRLALADDVIVNDASLSKLEREVEALHRNYRMRPGV